MSFLNLLSSSVSSGLQSKISAFILIFILACSIITGAIAKAHIDKKKYEAANGFVNFTIFINVIMLIYKIVRVIISTYSGGLL